MISIESNTYISSLLSQRNIWSTDELIKLFKKLLAPFESLDDSKIQPSDDVTFLKTIVNDLPYKISSYKCIVDNLYENNGMSCEELSINVFNAEFGLDLVAFIKNLNEKQYNLKKIKSIKLFYENEKKLSKALLLIKVLFPDLCVSAYNLCIEQIKKECKCNALLTINIFPHTYNISNKQYENISKLLIKSHFIYSHTIFYEYIDSDEQIGVSSFDCDYYWEDLTRCRFCKNNPHKYVFTTKSPIGGRKCCTKYSIYSTLSFEDLSIDRKYKIVLPDLCPGIPVMTLFNELQKFLYFERPFKGTHKCKHIDDTIVVKNDLYSFAYKGQRISYTLRSAIEEFPQYEISEGLDNNEEWASQVYGFYLNEAKNGNVECYNNLGVLHVLCNSLFDDFYIIDSEISQKIVDCFKLAANGGDTNAMINLASYFMTINFPEKAVKYYQMASEYGEAVGSFSMGIVYQFGLYGYKLDSNIAIKYYQNCIEQYFSDEFKSNFKSHTPISNCCLNLIILMYNLHYPFKNIVQIYKKIKKPSKELTYAYTVISNNMTNKAEDFFKVMHFNDKRENESSYIKFNRICAIYNGIKNGNNVIKSDKDAALKQLKELADTKCSDWPEWEKYVWQKLALWSYKSNEDPSIYIQYWKNCIKAKPEDECAYNTNIATVLSDDRSREIWKCFSAGQGCKSCHECTNYDSKNKCCPKAQFNWATKYEEDENNARLMLEAAAKQEYVQAMERFYIYNHHTIYYDETEDSWFKYGYVPDSFKPIIDKFAEDEIYDQLCHTANLGSKKAAALLMLVAPLRNDKYESIYWNGISGNTQDKTILLESIVNKTIKDGFFYPGTITEIDYIKYANKYAEGFNYFLALKGEKDETRFNFLKTLAEYYIDGEDLRKALSLYKKAKLYGFNISDRIKELEDEIERIEYENRRYNSYDYYNDRYTWEDSMMDALDGEPDAYWNID